MTNLNAVEQVQAIKQVREKMEKEKAEAEQNVQEYMFAPIREAHNQLVAAEAYVAFGSTAYRLRWLDPHTTEIQYVLRDSRNIDEFSVDCWEDTQLRFYCNSSKFMNQLDGFKTFKLVDGAWRDSATSLYLEMMSYLVVFPPAASFPSPPKKRSFWERIIPQNWLVS